MIGISSTQNLMTYKLLLEIIWQITFCIEIHLRYFYFLKETSCFTEGSNEAIGNDSIEVEVSVLPLIHLVLIALKDDRKGGFPLLTVFAVLWLT